jgi:diadenosine tetraphosphatase ApaH/serine/threonine PP2A family protein phosphatase
MLAIISDIHANLDALEAVFEEIDKLPVDETICLGDVVGYGPEPEACVDLVRERCAVTLCGNHDFALIYGANDFSAQARDAVERQRRKMIPRPGIDNGERQERWDFLKNLPYRHVRGDWLFVHAAPRNPVIEYLRKMDVLLGMREKMTENFDLVDWLCFVGHTHQPGVITQDMTFLDPAEMDYHYEPRPHTKAIVNVGSVGQPRDGDWRACFATVTEEGHVTWRRLAYDVDATAQKITAIAAMDNALADRLRKGR